MEVTNSINAAMARQEKINQAVAERVTPAIFAALDDLAKDYLALNCAHHQLPTKTSDMALDVLLSRSLEHLRFVGDVDHDDRDAPATP